MFFNSRVNTIFFLYIDICAYMIVWMDDLLKSIYLISSMIPWLSNFRNVTNAKFQFAIPSISIYRILWILMFTFDKFRNKIDNHTEGIILYFHDFLKKKVLCTISKSSICLQIAALVLNAQYLYYNKYVYFVRCWKFNQNNNRPVRT